MSDMDYGPLAGLIGSWSGDKGEDVAPEPDGIENNAYREKIIFSAADQVDNAEQQELISVHYRQVVHRISDEKQIHDQTGYWIWDGEAKLVMHSFSIPRGICVNAGGQCQIDDAVITFEVSAEMGDAKWQIIQSEFLHKNALTKRFSQQLKIEGDKLFYSQVISLEIYGKSFEHTDVSHLKRD